MLRQLLEKEPVADHDALGINQELLQAPANVVEVALLYKIKPTGG
jgi:hypothetical protein